MQALREQMQSMDVDDHVARSAGGGERMAAHAADGGSGRMPPRAAHAATAAEARPPWAPPQPAIDADMAAMLSSAVPAGVQAAVLAAFFPGGAGAAVVPARSLSDEDSYDEDDYHDDDDDDDYDAEEEEEGDEGGRPRDNEYVGDDVMRRMYINPEAFRFENRYELEVKLDSGHFAEVWRAEDLDTGFFVAIKRVSRLPRHRMPAYVQPGEIDEVSVMRQLEHPNIVRMLDSYVEPGMKEFLVLEYLPGGDLYNALNEEEVQLAQFPGFMVQIASALEHLHGKDLVHCDLKLENILLDGERQMVKVCDFGLAGRNGQVRKGIPHGTPEYMPPELLAVGADDMHVVHPSSDIWSFACVIMALLFGLFPWKVADVHRDAEFRHFVEAGPDAVSEQAPWSAVAPQFRECLLSMFDPSPRARPNISFVLRQLRRPGGQVAEPVAPEVHGAPPPSPPPPSPPLLDVPRLAATWPRRMAFPHASH